ncbi:TOBE domain-containing protein, partial [Ensifer sp. IC4062]|nr:TOBE domain-containing protein [Ensifer sp. IC4062]
RQECSSAANRRNRRHKELPAGRRFPRACRVVRCGRRVKIGIRPEALRLANADAPGFRVRAHLEVMELTGPELVTTAKLGGQTITACLPPRTRLSAGSEHIFSFDAAALHLFDPETGRSLLTA